MYCVRNQKKFFVIAIQLCISVFAEIAGVRLFPMYHKDCAAYFVRVLQNRHIQEGERGSHVPAVVGVEGARVIAAACFIVRVIILEIEWRVFRHRVSYAACQCVCPVFVPSARILFTDKFLLYCAPHVICLFQRGVSFHFSYAGHAARKYCAL